MHIHFKEGDLGIRSYNFHKILKWEHMFLVDFLN